MSPDHHGETADLASMAAIAAIMSSEFRRTNHIRRRAIEFRAAQTCAKRALQPPDRRRIESEGLMSARYLYGRMMVCISKTR